MSALVRKEFGVRFVVRVRVRHDASACRERLKTTIQDSRFKIQDSRCLSVPGEIEDDDSSCVSIERKDFVDMAGRLFFKNEEQALDEDEAERTVTRREER